MVADDLELGRVLRLLLTRSAAVLRGTSYRVRLDSLNVHAALEVRGEDGWALTALPGTRLPIFGAGEHSERFTWDSGGADVPWLEEMMFPALFLSSLRSITARQVGRSILLSAVPRDLSSGDCAAIVLPGSPAWRARLDPRTGTLHLAESVDDRGTTLERVSLTWLSPPTSPNGEDARRRTSAASPAEEDLWAAALDVMCGALHYLHSQRWGARFVGYLTKAGLIAVRGRQERERATGGRTSQFSGGSEWRYPGWSPWLEWPDSAGADTRQVALEDAANMAGSLPTETRHASYEEVAWDGQTWRAAMLGPDGTAFYERAGPFTMPRPPDQAVRQLPNGWAPYWAAMVPEMLDPALILGSLEYRSITYTGTDYTVSGAPRGMRLRPYPAVVHPDGDSWEGIVDGVTGVLKSCRTLREGIVLSEYRLEIAFASD